jgi:hypothetical protein
MSDWFLDKREAEELLESISPVELRLAAQSLSGSLMFTSLRVVFVPANTRELKLSVPYTEIES